MLHYFVVVWRPEQLSWAEFRNRVIGSTSPTGREQGALRAYIMQNWKELDLRNKPSMVANCVHGSASPLEGYFEKDNGTRTSVSQDLFGQQLLDLGFTQEHITKLGCGPKLIDDRDGSAVSV